MAKVRKHIFRLSDLFLVLGFVPMAVFLIFGPEFMQYHDPDMVALPLYWIVPLFIVLVFSWGIYIYLELDRGNVVNKYALWVFLILMLVGVFSILSQNQDFSINTYDINGNPVTVGTTISDTHLLFFTFDIIGILMFVYIGVFIFPKRFSSVWPIKIFGYLIFFLCFTLTIHSYCIETDKYYPFLKALAECDEAGLNANQVKSIIVNPNSMGMVLLVGTVFCYINHSLSKHRWFYWLMAIYFYFSMLFTYCRTAIVIAPTLFFIYVYYVLIHTFKEHDELNSVLLVIITLILIGSTTVVLISILSEGQYIDYFYRLYKIFMNEGSMESRIRIWNNTYQLIAQTMPMSLIVGRGFGTVNMELLSINNFKMHLYPTHNGYLNLLAEGGFIYLFSYLLLMGYVIWTLVKNYKNNPKAVAALTLGLASFAVYSLDETIHYFTYPFMFMIFVFDSAKKKTI